MVSTHGNFKILVLMSLLLTSGFTQAATAPAAMDLYNQSCDASTDGRTPQALALFQQAMDAGFDDLRYAQTDPDLAGITATREFKDLLVAHQSRLTLLSSERGFELKSGKWTSWASMESTTGPLKKPAELRLKWQPLGLDFEVKISGKLAADFSDIKLSPEAGGPSLMISTVVLDGISPYESANAFHFLLGKNKSSATGSLYMNPGWQQVNELAPTITEQDNGRSIIIKGTIAWQILMPYHPLVDTTMGLNVSVQSDASGKNAQVLFPDPQSFTPGASIHRFVPMIFKTDTAPNEAMVGRMSQSVVSNDPLICDLTVISSEPGTGYLKMDFLNDQGKSLLPEGARSLPVELMAGVNSLTRSADFRALNLGPYLVKVDLKLPSGEQLVWSSMILNMGPDWETKFSERMEKLQEKDRPTANYYLSTITTAMDKLPARRHPGSMSTTLLELDAFLDAGLNQGSILPQSGVFLLAWNDASGNERFCSVYLPDGHLKADALDPVVLWAGAPGFERRLAARIGKFCEYPRKLPKPNAAADKKFSIYLVPHPPAQPFADLSEEVADLDIVLNWVQSYFGTRKVSLAGMNAAAGPVLEYSLQKPAMLSRILIYSGALLNSWPDMDAADLALKFPAEPAGFPPLTWIAFITETQSTGQGKLLLSVMEEAGYIVKPVQEVRGGLSLSQVTDRLVLWAE